MQNRVSGRRLVAILGGRRYRQATTMRLFFNLQARQSLAEQGVDFIVATNNPAAAGDYRQIPGLKVVEASDEFKAKFRAGRKEMKDNLGAETRELINQYALDNDYTQVIHLDDNIRLLQWVSAKTSRAGWDWTRHNSLPLLMLEIIKMLFDVSEYSNAGSVGIKLAGYPPKRDVWRDERQIGIGFPYSLFCHKPTPEFHFTNATEDDILMSFWNGEHGRPSIIIRGFAYGKTSKRNDLSGNRQLYADLATHRGDYCESLYPRYYTKSVSYRNKSCTKASVAPVPQFKHRMIVPPSWKDELVVQQGAHDAINKCRDAFDKICLKERNESAKIKEAEGSDAPLDD